MVPEKLERGTALALVFVVVFVFFFVVVVNGFVVVVVVLDLVVVFVVVPSENFSRAEFYTENQQKRLTGVTGCDNFRGMSLSTKRRCPVCEAKFEPLVEWQVCCTPEHGVVLRMRRYRERKRCGGGDDGGGGRQRRLFPKPLLTKGKPPRPVPVAEPTLFETDLLASFGGAVEYGRDGFASDKNRYSVKSEPLFSGAKHAA